MKITGRTFKIAVALLLAVSFFVSASGCGENKKPESPKFSSVPMPSVSADTIDYYWSGDMEYNCFVFGKDGKYGTLNDNGEIVSAPALDSVHIGLNYDENGGYSKWALLGTADENEYLISESGVISAVDPYPIGFEEYCVVYWAAYEPVMVVYGIDGGEQVDCDFNTYYSYEFISENAYMSYPKRSGISRVIPVREITAMNYVEDNGYGKPVPEYKSDKYGLFSFDTNKMLTGFIYDDCSKFAVDGVFAAKKGDKWGYITDSGEEITKFGFEASLEIKEFESARTEMFQPVNGYIVTKKGGKYGLINTLGETVVANKYDYLSQVSPGGVFWALKDGVWSRCEPKTETTQ